MKNYFKKKEKKIKNKKYNIKKNKNLIINLLFKSKNMYGDEVLYTKKDIIPFIFGIRFNYTIINLKNVTFYLKRIFNLLQKILKKKKNILIIGDSDDINFLLNKNYIKNNKNILYFNKKWINGLITNDIINNINNKISFLLKKNKIQLIIVIKSSINDNFLKKELLYFKIPIISFIKTSQNYENINYPVISNLKNIKSIYILMFLLRKFF